MESNETRIKSNSPIKLAQYRKQIAKPAGVGPKLVSEIKTNRAYSQTKQKTTRKLQNSKQHSDLSALTITYQAQTASTLLQNKWSTSEHTLEPSGLPISLVPPQ